MRCSLIIFLRPLDFMIVTGEQRQEKGLKVLMLGNEAIARGLMENGNGFSATYPGTPSSEVGNTLERDGKKTGMYFQYSINEKVAYEIAYGASLSGLRSSVFMKHVGLNVASDPFVTSVYTGVGAGMIVMVADDPSMFSSQNEQDSRRYADLAHAPMIEPSTPQECKDFVRIAFEISEKYSLPVLYRTSTRVSHMRSQVELDELVKPVNKKDDVKSMRNHTTSLPSNARKSKEELLHKMSALGDDLSFSSLNRIERYGNSRIGIITSGSSYNQVYDAIFSLGIEVNVLKLGLTNPIPQEITMKFLKENDMILIAEELDPYLETKVRTYKDILGLPTEIHGKIDRYMPWSYEMNPHKVMNALRKMTGEEEKEISSPRPASRPDFCPGCPHRSTFYVVKRALKLAGKTETVLSSDIGCYSLSYYDPYQAADIMLDMGASISVGSGISLASGQKVVAFIGDSTFYHSGITALANAVRSGANMLIVILDNSTTAMTGQEPTPELDAIVNGSEFKGIPMEGIIKACGITDLTVVDSYDQHSLLRTVGNEMRKDGISVIISRGECALIDRKTKAKREKYSILTDKCSLCRNCIDNFHCPAIQQDTDGHLFIDSSQCDGCGMCADVYVCPFKAIEVVQ